MFERYRRCGFSHAADEKARARVLDALAPSCVIWSIAQQQKRQAMGLPFMKCNCNYFFISFLSSFSQPASSFLASIAFLHSSAVGFFASLFLSSANALPATANSPTVTAASSLVI